MIKTIITAAGEINMLRFVLFGLILSISACTGPDSQKNTLIYNDIPYVQDYAEKFEIQLDGVTPELLQVRSDRNKKIEILSSGGLLQPWEKKLVADKLYRPLSEMKIISLNSYKDQFVYLTDKEVFSNAWAGKFYFEHDIDKCTHFAIGDDFSALIAASGKLALFMNSELVWEESPDDFEPLELLFDSLHEQFLILAKSAVYSLDVEAKQLKQILVGEHLSSMALIERNSQIAIGTDNGYFTLDSETFNEISPLNNKLPHPNISCVREINGNLWFGSTKGAFMLRDDDKFNYYASKRWLVDDCVRDIFQGPDKSVLVLTENGLSKINFTEMTLAEKAEYFQEIQRLRHVRYGFGAETSLMIPGDLSSAVLHDTDNDGLWTSMYLAGELFRYASTKSDDALQNAYEAFEAMERLTEISGIKGFPARTYEIDGYQSSDTDPNMPEDEKIWRLTEDERWRWKSTTSSDESCGHFFVYALFAEIAPDQEWRDRAIHQIKIEMDHIIEHDWYLVTWNGKRTEWGRWNPEYVNSFPITVGDRRLNSTLILAFLQTAYHFTGEDIYKEKAKELMKDHGYDENASRLATVVGEVEGQSLSDTWNHSDDEMYFLTIPAFVNYAFDDDLKEKFFKSSQSHWEVERSEKNPLWNFLYLLTGGEDFDLDESVWWLKEFPMDLISWNVDNSHRQDLTKVEPNFRRQEYTEVLPRDERPMHLHNNAYRNNGGNGGREEYPPYIYLLPYWAGRYAGVISPAE
ncbi:MAG: hypothetical protein KAH17_01610 [Bacteroidales bacterium]|nr:hypothetical protein [Bacteroidales bacterium]